MFKKIFKREGDVSERVKKLIRKGQKEALKEIDPDDEYDILLGLDNLNLDILEQELSEQWDNIQLLKFIEDIFDYLANYVNDNPEDIYRHYLKIKDVITENGETISSGTFRTDEPSDSIIYAVKNSQNKEELLREYAIARELDVFENSVFLKFYGVIPCSHVLTVDEEVISFCQTDNETSVIFQFLEGKVMSSFKLNTEEFFIIFIILLNALHQASSKGFTHYNLSNETVFLQKLKSPVLVKIYLPNTSIKYVKTKYFPFITNYASSRINTTEGDVYASEVNNSFFPMYDVYKFLMSTLSVNPNLKIEKLLNTFVTGLDSTNSKRYVDEQLIENEHFIISNDFKNYSIEKYLKNIKFELEKYSYTGKNTFHIVGDYVPKDYFKSYHLLIEREPQNSFEGEIAIKLKTGFEPEPTEWVDEIQELSEQLDAFKDEITEPNLTGDAFRKKYFEYTDRFKTYQDHYERLKEQQLIPKGLTNLIGEISLKLIKWSIRYQLMIEDERLTDERKAVNLPRVQI